MKPNRRRALAGCLTFCLLHGLGSAAIAKPAPVVIAATEGGGINVLHSDFRAAGPVRLPKGMPAPTVLTLPSKGSFEERIEAANAGAFGDLKAGHLYLIRGTRLLIYTPADLPADFDLFGDRSHATGVVAAAGGREHGTNPDALLLYVPSASADGWSWLAKQQWIDVVSTSYYPLVSTDDGRCYPTQHIRKIVGAGRLVFSASGNVEQAGAISSPSGVPESYQVGGVDDEGRSYVPGVSGAATSVTPTRAYETGDRFDFPSASADALTGSMPFGGTSGATPSTAGRAGDLIQFARSLLGSNWTGVQHGKVASLVPGHRAPAKGPLADGDLTSAELTDVLHRSAAPFEAPNPLRYLIEGYGAHSADTIAFAKDVLAGKATLPDRSDEDAMHQQVEEMRAHLMTATACG